MELLEHLAQCCGGGGGGGGGGDDDAAAGPPTGTATDAPRPVVVVVKSEKLVTEILKAEKPPPHIVKTGLQNGIFRLKPRQFRRVIIRVIIRAMAGGAVGEIRLAGVACWE